MIGAVSAAGNQLILLIRNDGSAITVADTPLLGWLVELLRVKSHAVLMKPK